MVSLENSGVADLGRWNRFSIDLADYLKAEVARFLKVTINFKRRYASFACEGETEESLPQNTFEDQDWDNMDEESYWDSYEDYYYPSDYSWRDRDNPCTNSYYVSKAISRNVIASDLGIIAKSGNGGKTGDRQ